MAADASFRAMGSDAHVIVVGGPAGLVDGARRRLEELERRWSRFLPDSEVSRLNARTGRPLAVSDDTRVLLRRALDGVAITNGAFDPTVLGAVLRLGYDRTFTDIAEVSAGPLSAPSARSGLGLGAGGIVVDDGAGTVTLPLGVGFDPGGIGKGLAADLVVAELLAAGAAGACVNVGGDLRVAGVAPDGWAWHVGIDHPDGGPALGTIDLDAGAVATTSRTRRRWTDAAGVGVHHVVDPATGDSARTEALAVTVVAATGWQAEVLAKATFLAACDRFTLVDRLGAAALVADTHTVRTSAHWGRFTPDDRRMAS